MSSLWKNKYNKILAVFLENLSNEINQNTQTYQNKIANLNYLLTDLEINQASVNIINDYLLEEISQIPVTNSKISIKINFNQELFQDLQNRFYYQVIHSPFAEYHQNNVEAIAYKESIQSILIEGLKEILIEENTVEISCEEFNGNSNDIVDEYIQNYIKLINNPNNYEVIKFSKESVLSYYHLLEYRLNSDDDTSILSQHINGAIEEFISVFVQRFDDIVDNEDFKSVEKNLIKEFGWIRDANSEEMFEKSCNEFKNGIRSKIILMANRVNNEIFPSQLESKINESITKNQGKIQQLVDILSLLESNRELVFEILEENNLNDYVNYVVLNEVDNFKEAKDEFFRISPHVLGQGMPLKEFLDKRNTLVSMIEKQFDSEGCSYLFVKKTLDEMKNNEEENLSLESESGQTLIIYFIKSVELFIEELEKSVLGDLSLTFEDFQKSSKITVSTFKELGLTYQEEIAYKQAIEKEKIQNIFNELVVSNYTFSEQLSEDFYYRLINSSENSKVALVKFLEKIGSDPDKLNDEIKKLLSSTDIRKILFDKSKAEFGINLKKIESKLNLEIPNFSVVAEVIDNDELWEHGSKFIESAFESIPLVSPILKAGRMMVFATNLTIDAIEKKSEEIEFVKIEIVSHIREFLTLESYAQILFEIKWII